MKTEEYKFESYDKGVEKLSSLGFRMKKSLGGFILPTPESHGSYLEGLPEAVPTSCIPWPVGELRPDGTFIFDDSTNTAVEKYKDRVREGLNLKR